MSNGEPDRETAFSLLADQTRERIIEELGAATASPETGIPRLTYADLKSRVGIRDSGQFNYHLKKLVGNYVAKEEGGYRLRWPGMVLYRTLVAGFFTNETDTDIERFSIGQSCHRCGEEIEAHRYETLFRVRCWGCEANYTDVFFPSHGLNSRDKEELLQAVHRRNRLVLSSMTAGQCPWCTSEVSAELVECDGTLPSLHDTRDLGVYAVYHCTDCTGFQYIPVSQILLYHPLTIAFYYDHNRDLTTIPSWELGWAVTAETTTIHSRDPWSFTVTIPLADEQLLVKLDETLSVVDSQREQR